MTIRLIRSWHTLRLPLFLTLLWCLLLFALYCWTVQREDEYADELARIQTATLFSSIVDTRAWNADHGGVWAKESPACPVNPWLPEEDRVILTPGGERLVKINPAYMTRQIAEHTSRSLARFRISSLTPVRPANRADLWETAALLDFHEGVPEAFALVETNNRVHYRYMAPLTATENCLVCHKNNAPDDVLGGISVSISADPLHDAAAARKRTTGLAFGLIGLIGTVGIGGATLQINRKKEQAEAANRTKSAFLANMSHDMRTPLSGILGMAELLERDVNTPRNRCLLSSLRAATDSLLDVVDGIMRYALLEAEGQATQNAPFSLRAEVESCMAALRPACAGKGLVLKLVMEPEEYAPQVSEQETGVANGIPDRFLGDGFRLRQALGNLLGNAVKFTERGSVTLRIHKGDTFREGGRSFLILRFSVIDTGMGIPVKEQGRIFERFEQGSAAQNRLETTEDSTGVGLGLSIARSIAHRFGGELTLSSTPGSGSTFMLTARFELDLAPAGTAIPMQNAPNEPALHKKMQDAAALTLDTHTPISTESHALCWQKLVVAEDTPVTALFLHEALSGAGYSVHMTNSGDDARYLIQNIQPDMALLDMRMPGIGGLELATEIRQGKVGVNPDLPLMVLTATLSPDDENTLRRLNINGWFIKPVQTDILLGAVGRILRESAATPCLVPETDRQTTDIPCANEHLQRFDRAAALEDLDGNDALLHQLSALFLSEEPPLQEALRATLETLFPQPMPHAVRDSKPDRARLSILRRQAHSLKNSAATLHLIALRITAATLEVAISSTSETPRTSLLHALQDVLRALDEACSELRQAGYGETASRAE